MSMQSACPYCGRPFENKENLLQCPNCHMTLPASAVSLTSLAAALRYMVLISGTRVLEKKHTVLALLMDLMPGNQKERRLAESAYLAAEPEIADFVRCASAVAAGRGKKKSAKDSAAARKEMMESVEKLILALHRDFLQPDKIDSIVAALLGAYSLDPAVYMRKSGRGPADSRVHDLHMEPFVHAVSEVQEGGGSVWKDCKAAAAAMASAAPQLKAEADLLSSVGKHAGESFFALMQAIGNPDLPDGDEKMYVARLQSELREAYLETGAIDFFLEGILKAGGLEYTQSFGAKSGQSSGSAAAVPARPRKTPQTAAQNQQAGNSRPHTRQSTGQSVGQPVGQTVGQSAGQSSGQTVGRSAGQSASQAAGQSAGRSAGQPTGGSSRTAAANSKKKKHPIITLVVLGSVLYIASGVILPMVRNLHVGSEAQETAEDDQTVEGGQTAEIDQTTEAEKESTADPYADPAVSASSADRGVYGEKLLSPSRYAPYQGSDELFSFAYPTELYDSVDYSSENDGRDVDIAFHCSEGSSLFVSCHPYESTDDIGQYKEAAMSEELSGLTDGEIVSVREYLETSLAGTKSASAYTFYVRGTDASDSSLARSVWYRISDKKVMIMRLTYPQGSSTEDTAIRAYYEEVMYDLCGFGGNTDYPAWDDFKEDYGL